MPDNNQPKMVPEKDLIALKERLRKTQDQLSEREAKVTELTASAKQLERQLSAAKASGVGDEEVEKVRQYLLDEDARISKAAREHDTRDSSLRERERKVRAKELVAEYKAKGLNELNEDALLETEDMESTVKNLHTEFLVKENERLANTPRAGSPEAVFESGQGGVIKKQPKDMSDAEFESHWNAQMQGALSKK